MFVFVFIFLLLYFTGLWGFRCLWSPGCWVESLAKRGRIGKRFTALYQNLVCISVYLVSRTHMGKIRISLGGGVAYVFFFFFFGSEDIYCRLVANCLDDGGTYGFYVRTYTIEDCQITTSYRRKEEILFCLGKLIWLILMKNESPPSFTQPHSPGNPG